MWLHLLAIKGMLAGISFTCTVLILAVHVALRILPFTARDLTGERKLGRNETIVVRRHFVWLLVVAV